MLCLRKSEIKLRKMATKQEVNEAAKGSTIIAMPKLGDYVGLFSKYKETISQIMPTKAIEAERVVLICAKVFAESEYLQKCNLQSMVGAVIQAALHGMNPDPSAGLVYFVPYGGMVKLMLGYKGQELQAYKSGQVESISACCIYEGDEFDLNLAAKDPVPYHRPGKFWGIDDTKIIWSYSKFWMRGGGLVCQPINRNMIEKRRASSSNTSTDPRKNPWIANYRQMAEKCGIKETADHAPKHDDWRDIDNTYVPDLDLFKRDQSGKMTDEPLTPIEVVEDKKPETPAEKEERENREAFEAQQKKEQGSLPFDKPQE